MNRVLGLVLAPVLVLVLVQAAAQPSDDGATNGRAGVDDIDPAVDFSRELEPAREPARGPEPDAGETGPEPASPPARDAVDTLDLGTTSITGNRELPRVLYIVPWKQSDLGDLVGRPVDTLLDEALAPVDPDVFERHVDYYETLYGESQEELSQ